MRLNEFWASLLWGAKDAITAMATEIVLACREDVWDHVWTRVLTMGEAEAKGYTRARTTLLSASLVNEMLERHPNLGDWARKALMDEVADQMAYQVWFRAEQAKKAYTHYRAAA